jgi:hypothetical protein
MLPYQRLNISSEPIEMCHLSVASTNTISLFHATAILILVSQQIRKSNLLVISKVGSLVVKISQLFKNLNSGKHTHAEKSWY